MSKSIYLLCGLFLMMPITAYSWGKVGNGGFIINCSGKKQVFDTYEGEVKHNLTYASLPGLNLNEKVNHLLNKLQSIDPNRAKNYRFQFNNFWSKAKVDYRTNIFYLNQKEALLPANQKYYGLGPIKIAEDCQLQLALEQIEPIYQNGLRQGRLNLTIYNTVWKELTLDQQARLILHELFYRENILLRFNNTSFNIRKLNALVTSENFKEINQNIWHQELNKAKFSPMFPNFHYHKEVNEFDLEVDRGSWLGFKTWRDDGPIMHGSFDFNQNQTLNVIAESPFYFHGLYPEFFSLQETTLIDFSFLTPDLSPLKLNVSIQCLFQQIGFNKNGQSQMFFQSLGYSKDGQPSRICHTEVVDYHHPLIVKKEWVHATIKVDQFSFPEKVLFLTRDKFSKLTVLIENKETPVQSLKVNLDTQEIFDVQFLN